jgi:ribosomal protein L40E
MESGMARQIQQQLSLDQAYQAAYLWLDHIGDPPIEISEPAHGSVELVTEQAFVRVRSSDTPVEQSSVLALLRAADSGKRLMIFSPSGFSPGARSIAQTQGIALFSLDPSGRAVAETTHARSMTPDSEPEPPFSPESQGSDDGFWSNLAANPSDNPETPQEIQATTNDWSDCPTCGATHYHNARFCRDCGTDLSGHHDTAVPHIEDAMDVPATPKTTTGNQLRCRTCGSHDIELID